MEKFSEIKYVRPDYSGTKKTLAKLTKVLKNAESYDEFKQAYLQIEELVKIIYTANSICHVRNTLDVNDEYYDKENIVNGKESSKLSIALLKTYKVLLGSKYRKDFDKEFGSFISKSLEAQLKLISKKILLDQIKENKLTQQYAKDSALCKTNFRGEECNFYGLLKHMQSTDQQERKEAFEAWSALYESVSSKLDDTYTKLVKNRVKQAKKLGFNNYIDMAYLNRGRFDYTVQDAANFREAVRTYIVPLCVELRNRQAKRLGLNSIKFYDESLMFKEGNALPIGDKNELVNKAKKMYEEMSKESGEFFNFMIENDLFDLDTRVGKRMGGYTTFFPSYNAPFIFSNFNGTSADIDVLTHEAGHAFQAYLASRTLPISEQIHSTSEINEIHSMSMEHFAYPWMELFFGDKANKYLYTHLVDSILTIPYLVSVDEFQHRVFENPKMNAMDRRKVWHDIEVKYLPWRDYDGNKFLEEGGFWMQKQHIFLYPFYYIEYALAQICAYQFFIRSRKDKAEAWDSYIKLCKLGGSLGYFDLLKAVDLKNPFDENNIKYIVDEIKNIINEFEIKLEH